MKDEEPAQITRFTSPVTVSLTVSPTVFAPSMACFLTVETTRFTRVTGETPRFLAGGLPRFFVLPPEDSAPDEPPRDEPRRGDALLFFAVAELLRADGARPDDPPPPEPRPLAEDFFVLDARSSVAPDLLPDFPPARPLPPDDFVVAAMVFSW